LACLILEGEGTAFLHIVRNYAPNDTSHPRRPVSSDGNVGYTVQCMQWNVIATLTFTSQCIIMQFK